jgi:phosphoribosylformylglycinamidine synthase
MAIASGIGAKINALEGADPIPVFFGEDQGRYLVTIRDMPDLDDFSRFMAEVRDAGIFAPWIGTTGGNTLALGDARPIPVTDLQAAHEGWFPAYMAGEM